MREITLLKNLIGSTTSISLRNKLKTTLTPAADSYLIGATQPHATSLEDIFTAFNLTLPSLIPPEYESVYSTFLGDSDVDWSLALGSKRLAQELNRFRKEVIPLVEKIESTGYVETLISGRKIFELLQPIRVDETKVRSLINDGESLNSFIPESLNICAPIHYTHGTRTGRLRVVSGPRVLTMNKQHRNVITSRYLRGSIMSVDFVSLEPRLALHAVGKTSPGDIYEDIAKISSESRAKTKIATLSLLYGAASSDLVSDKLRRHVRDYFSVTELMKKIESHNGKNGYGRPLYIEEERLAIPHWVQSTAVDICLLGFSELAQKLSGIADPLFMIHDALYLDVPESNTQRLSEILQGGIMVSPYGKFQVSLNDSRVTE